MKRHICWSKILTFFLCAMLLVAPLFQPALAADGEEESHPIVINTVPYSINQEFYKVDTGLTEDVVVKDENGNDIVETVPVYDTHYDYYYKYTATRAGRLTVQLKATDVYCSASIAVNGVNGANIYTDGTKSAYVDLCKGDVVTIHLSVTEDTTVKMSLDMMDYPKGSKYNPIKTTLAELGSGISVKLNQDESFYYTFTAPETGVIQFYTSDAYANGDGEASGSMPFQQQVIVNEDRVSAFTSFMRQYRVVVSAGETVTFAVECPGYAVAGGYTLYAEYVPPFVLDDKGQGDVFSGMYMVEYTSNEDGSKHCMYAVRFSYGKKTVTVMNVKDCIALGTYSWTYNLDTGALDIPGAPFEITVEEDVTQDLGCYLKLHFNGGYAMISITEEPKPNDIVAKLLNGKYEDVYNGKVYEVLTFDYEAGTLTIAKDWNSSKVTVYTMGAFDIFTGEMTYTDSKGESIQIGVSGGKVIYYGNPLTPVEAPHVHEYTTVVTAPTCTADGYTTFTCECGDTYTGEVVATSGHKYESVVTEPTCTEGGYTTHTCAVCGAVKTDSKTDAAGHKYESVVTEPTCTEGGYTTHTCSVCGDIKTDGKTNATGHNYGAWTDAGEKHGKTCANCGDVITAEHAWNAGVVEKEPTEDENGNKKLTCADCGAVKNQIIPALGHTHKYTASTTAPTCTEAGYTTYTCTCGDSYKENGDKALGHKYDSVVTAPTCTEGGYTTHTCSACGNVKVDSKVSAAGHKYDSVVTAPTCTEGGYTTHTCSACGNVKVDTKVNATGHSYDDGILADGQITYTCSVCGNQYSEEWTVNALSVPGNMTGTVEGSMTFTWTATKDGHLIVDNIAAMTGAYVSVQINGLDAHPTDLGYVIATGDAVVITVTTYSELTFDIPVYIYEDQQDQGEAGAMEFEVTFDGWNIYEQTWVSPFTGTATFIVAQSDVSADALTFRVVDAAGNFYNQYEFGLDENGNQFVSLKVTEGDALTIIAYEDSMSAAGNLKIQVLEGEPVLHEHSYDAGVVTAPTCNTDGYTTFTCTVCGHTSTGDVVKASHTYETVTTDPSCTEAGFVTFTCSVCGHSYVEAGAGAQGHNLGQWEVVKEATTTSEGSRKRGCDHCDYEETETIPMIETTPTTTPATQPATQPATTAPATQPATTGGDSTAEPTGDSNMILIIAIVAVVVIGGIVAVVIIKKKK